MKVFQSVKSFTVSLLTGRLLRNLLISKQVQDIIETIPTRDWEYSEFHFWLKGTPRNKELKFWVANGWLFLRVSDGPSTFSNLEKWFLFRAIRKQMSLEVSKKIKGVIE